MVNASALAFVSGVWQSAHPVKDFFSGWGAPRRVCKPCTDVEPWIHSNVRILTGLGNRGSGDCPDLQGYNEHGVAVTEKKQTPWKQPSAKAGQRNCLMGQEISEFPLINPQEGPPDGFYAASTNALSYLRLFHGEYHYLVVIS